MKIHVLELSQQGTPQLPSGEILNLPTPNEPYVLRIVLPGTSPILNSTSTLLCNYPQNGAPFERNEFRSFDLAAPITGNCMVDIEISHSGSFSVRIPSDTPVEWDFMIQPPFKLGDEQVTPNALCVQTLLSKLVDPNGSVRSEDWKKTLENISAKHYNMIHFVPLQSRGASGSPFSITDQLGWDKHSFPQGEQDVEYLNSELKRLKLLGLSDIVLNHTASDSPWLADHLDAGYSAKTAPHLQAAIALDTALLEVGGITLASLNDLDQVDGIVRECADNTKLWEFYVLDVEQHIQSVEKHPFQGIPSSDLPKELPALASQLVNKAGKNFQTLGPRFNRKLDSTFLAEYVAGSNFSTKQIVDEANETLYNEFNDDLNAVINSIKDRQKYLRFDSNGPKLGSVVEPPNPKTGKQEPGSAPLIESYFNRNYGEPLACNGWVWGANPLIDHAGPESKAYIRRELIVWGDCTKLRYGKQPSDSPYLWEHMSKYARLLAKHFAGLRVDNAHSTPLHVGEFILDEARKVRPNLYVVAELFSGSQEMDKLYVERMGISSLLREAIMPGSPKDLSTVIQTNGGLAIGSLIDRGSVRGSKTHSWLMEVTHDNEMMAEKRTVEDTLSTAGLVAMCQVSSGSTYGSDECYAHSLNVVSEERRYKLGGGIGEAKSVLNSLHKEMSTKNMFESYTDWKGQYITVHRINPETGEGVFLVARTKFYPDRDQKLDPIRLEASRAEFMSAWTITKDGEPSNTDNHEIPVIPVTLHKLTIEAQNDDSGSTIIVPAEFTQGSVAIWRTYRTFDARYIEQISNESCELNVSDLSLLDLNVLLYHAGGEERVCSNGTRDVYSVPNLGPLVYAGLQGWETHLSSIVRNQDLGHPICANLRNGLWAFEYLINRLSDQPQFEKVQQYLKLRLDATYGVPTFLRPRYFVAAILHVYEAAIKHALKLMSIDFSTTSRFFQLLALTSVQFVAKLPNCSLYPDRIVPTMAAGLPHFSEGVMRCWGRDVFLSIGGLFTRLNRLEDAKQHILGFGSTLKYGLIPNLLDSGCNPRYNARDAVWFFAESVQDYCNETYSYDILHAKTRRRFPLDDSYTESYTDHESTIGEIIFEILARHARGIEFREHNAGPDIDMHMKSNGFNQKIWVDWDNGFVFGGNQDNCGTWQDKMGESPIAGSEGVPGTPRDGAAIEITGLLKSCLRWVNETRRQGKYPWPTTVDTQDNRRIHTEEWENLIQTNFERCYYIPDDVKSQAEYDVDNSVINRRGIYKDTYRSGKPYEDYQLRANFTVAVAVAPELFDTRKVSKTLQIADTVLRGPVGMATLDPSDWNYRPYYLNNIESEDFATSKGRNYHQGPEWVWQYGTFLQAYIHTMQREGVDSQKIIAELRSRIQGHIEWIENSPWRGLTELTQKNGEFCGDASPTQAWSSARLIIAISQITN